MAFIKVLPQQYIDLDVFLPGSRALKQAGDHYFLIFYLYLETTYLPHRGDSGLYFMIFSWADFIWSKLVSDPSLLFDPEMSSEELNHSVAPLITKIHSNSLSLPQSTFG